jgi:hypothetical protein
MMNPNRLAILLIACALTPGFVFSQDQSKREYVFRGTVSEAECRQLPVLRFDIGPSMDRANSLDRLAVQCEPGDTDKPGSLSLTFTLVGEIQPNDNNTKQYSFRWGHLVGVQHYSTVGQFTRDAQKCTTLVALFQSKVSKTAASTSVNIRESPQWTASCNPDDQWGTSMEIVLTGKIGESL